MQRSAFHKRFFTLLIGSIIVFSGCKSSVKQNWIDFRAHYNTYYNAKKSFESGLKKNDAQRREYNPLLPIRIHQEPLNAGMADFEKSIDKGADILRKFENSKWVDDAIELIGKSYYYRKEYFSADQKFLELYQATNSRRLKQTAIYWRGRTLLDMQVHEEAIEYLESEIIVFNGEWDKGLYAETNAILAQHYIVLENYEKAEEILAPVLKDLTSKDHKSRGYFLYGQLLELNEKLPEAYDAYDRVEKFYTDYNLLFQANVKKGQVARDLGKVDESYDLFEKLGKDDKNFTVKADLDFERAKAAQASGDFEEAEGLYQDVLGNTITKPSNVTIAKTYYGLAEINRYYYNDFRLAAAYYDSASQIKIAEEKLPENFDATDLKISFGEYIRLKDSIYLNDSLLWLGQLSEAELDSVVLLLRKQRKAELDAQLREAEARKNRLVTVSGNQQTQGGSNSNNGFLNFKNPVLLADARSQFQAIWGDRPLVDNWRRSAAIVITLSDSVESADVESKIFAGNSTIQLSDIQIDLSSVPFAQEERDSVRMVVAEELYEVGNLFFLSLNMPDSALAYFTKIIDDYPTSSAVPVTTYSLAELYESIGESENAESTAKSLIQAYPSTIYAQRLSQRYAIDIPDDIVEADTTMDLRSQYITLKDVEPDSPQKAEDLREFARNNLGYELSPIALIDASDIYSGLAKDSVFFDLYPTYQAEKDLYELDKRNLEIFKDSLNLLLEDSTTTDSLATIYTAQLDSSLYEPDFDQYFPYIGEYWDSTRVVLNEFNYLFRNDRLVNRVKRLASEILIPKSLLKPDDVVMDSLLVDSLLVEEPEVISGNYQSCEDLNVTPIILGGMEAFIQSLDIAFVDDNPRQDYELVYSMKISSEGELDQFNLIRGELDQEIIEYLEQVMEERLSFNKSMVRGKFVALDCQITFDLSPN